MTQFIEEVAEGISALGLETMSDDDRQYIFEALADFFMRNAKFLNPGEQEDGQKVQITVNIQVNPG